MISILVEVLSSPFFLPVLQLALVSFPAVEYVDSLPVELVVFPIAHVDLSGWILLNAVALPPAVDNLSPVLSAVVVVDFLNPGLKAVWVLNEFTQELLHNKVVFLLQVLSDPLHLSLNIG